MTFLTNLFEVITPELTSIPVILAYLAFVYATVGLANGSRHRHVDMRLAVAEGKGDEARREANQAELDFHNWYGSLLFITSIAELLGLGMFWASWHNGGPWLSLVLYGLVLLLSHIFCTLTYRKEMRDIFQKKEWYFWFLPWRFALALGPKQSQL